ncbi:MAG TPA: Uma2 family endonuclease [Actinomycetota bacterium]|nr:Uma2 family endonuclease [Actinomycetota bacterium]
MPGTTGLTYQALLAFPDDGLRRELLDGELIVSAAPRLRHQVILGRLHLLFGNFVEEHRIGHVYMAPTDVLLSDDNVVEPDLIFVADGRSEILTEMNMQGVPSLLIEVVSDPRIDRVRKRDVYARFGVPEYWVVDPDADRIEVYCHSPDGYGKPVIFEPGETLEYEGLPGLQIDLTRLFRRD